jgi:hypothetical protein
MRRSGASDHAHLAQAARHLGQKLAERRLASIGELHVQATLFGRHQGS